MSIGLDGYDAYEKKSFKHEFKVIPKEEVLANRSNAYQFIDFDKQETLEEKLDRIVSKEPSKFLEESDKRMEAKAKLFRYSEEEVLEILYKHTEDMLAGKKVTLEEWFDKVKKK